MPTIFTLLLSSHIWDTTADENVQILFNLLWKKATVNGKRNKPQFYLWLHTVIQQMSKTKGPHFTAQTMQKIIKMIVVSITYASDTNSFTTTANHHALKNKNKLKEKRQRRGSFHMKSNQWIWKEFFMHTDNDGNNILMTLAKHEMDEILQEILTNDITSFSNID